MSNKTFVVYETATGRIDGVVDLPPVCEADHRTVLASEGQDMIEHYDEVSPEDHYFDGASISVRPVVTVSKKSIVADGVDEVVLSFPATSAIGFIYVDGQEYGFEAGGSSYSFQADDPGEYLVEITEESLWPCQALSFVLKAADTVESPVANGVGSVQAAAGDSVI